jgi:hypothetical protein
MVIPAKAGIQAASSCGVGCEFFFWGAATAIGVASGPLIGNLGLATHG